MSYVWSSKGWACDILCEIKPKIKPKKAEKKTEKSRKSSHNEALKDDGSAEATRILLKEIHGHLLLILFKAQKNFRVELQPDFMKK